MDLSVLAHVEPAALRALIPGWLAEFIDDPERSAHVGARLAAMTQEWSDDACLSVASFIRDLGADHRVYPAHPACRDVSRVWCEEVLFDTEVRGTEHLLASATAGPTMVLGNHLSYVDANATDAVLALGGHEPLADKIIAAAGPKVYQDVFRRFAAGCINTLPVPQSTTLGHTAKLAPRELARRAKASMLAAAGAMAEGNVVLIYPEGSRSRNGRLQPFVRGVHRWLSALDGLRVVPLALVGTTDVMPIGAGTLRPGKVTLTFGEPLQVGPDGTSREVLAAIHGAVGSLLPEHLRPPAGSAAVA